MTEQEYIFDCGWSAEYPIQPDQHRSRVWVLAESYPEAMCTAALMTACRKGVAMVTSTVYVE